MENPKNKRPLLSQEILHGISAPEEEFQNRVLRPIIKMQSDLLMLHTLSKIKELKIDWPQINIEEKRKILLQLFSKNQSFKSELVGMVVGHFTVEEYDVYLTMQKETNRRINQIIHNRMLDLLLRSS